MTDVLSQIPLPSGWASSPLWSHFRRRKRTGYGHEELLSVYRDHGVIPRDSRDDNFNKASDDLSAYQLVEVGDLVVNKMKAWQGSLGVSAHRGIVSPAYFVYVPKSDLDSRFAHYLLRSQPYASWYRAISKGIRPSQWDLIPEDFGSVPVLTPPLDEQRAIADFLDRETAQIDAMVNAQERLVALLQERRVAFLTHAVWGFSKTGLARNLQQVPLKYAVISVDQGWSPQCENFAVEGPEEWAVLKAGSVNHGVFRPSENKKLPDDLEPRPDMTLREGDIVVSRANTRDLVGSAAMIPEDHPKLMLSDKLYRLKLDRRYADPAFVAMVLNSAHAREELELAATGTSHSMQNISRADILNLSLPLPPLHCQVKLAESIQSGLRSMDEMVAKAQESIALMKERRAALISAAVTGRIDVRTGAEQVERELEEAIA